jgi:hypothetical protein
LSRRDVIKLAPSCAAVEKTAAKKQVKTMTNARPVKKLTYSSKLAHLLLYVLQRNKSRSTWLTRKGNG